MDHDWKQYAGRSQWENQWSVQCLVVDSLNPLWEADAVFEKEVFIKSIERVCKRYRSSSFVFSKGFRVMILFPEPEEGAVTSVRRRLLNVIPKRI